MRIRAAILQDPISDGPSLQIVLFHSIFMTKAFPAKGRHRGDDPSCLVSNFDIPNNACGLGRA